MATQGKGPLLLIILLISCLIKVAHQYANDDNYCSYTLTDESKVDHTTNLKPLLRLKRDDEIINQTKVKDSAKSSKKASFSNKSDLSNFKKKPLIKKESKEIKSYASSTSTATPLSSTTTFNNNSSGAATVENVSTVQPEPAMEITTVPNSVVVDETETSIEDNTFESIPFPDGGEEKPYEGDGDPRPFTPANNATVDNHRYYKSETYTGATDSRKYWVELDQLAEEVVVNKMLSDSHRRAASVTLKFDFPFYGHMLRNLTIATGGFLFTGNFVHTWLAATQYIAPLMANFDTSQSEDAVVKYADNGYNFTVQWENVILKDHKDAGSFTFQVTLNEKGDIVFVYKDVPVTVSLIQDKEHPVKVGLSDAYIVDRTIFYVRRKTIYEYHKIDMKRAEVIGNWTTIHFKALPTCVSFTNCTTCLSSKLIFECQWCNKIGRCSNGLDRYRQQWLHSGCDALHSSDVDECKNLIPPPPRTNIDVTDNVSNIDTFGQEAMISASAPDIPSQKSNVGTVVGIIFLFGLIIGLVGWIAYAYFFPHSTSGQILIKYRPSRWSWRRGEARYTAAAIHSIHM